MHRHPNRGGAFSKLIASVRTVDKDDKSKRIGHSSKQFLNTWGGVAGILFFLTLVLFWSTGASESKIPKVQIDSVLNSPDSDGMYLNSIPSIDDQDDKQLVNDLDSQNTQTVDNEKDVHDDRPIIKPILNDVTIFTVLMEMNDNVRVDHFETFLHNWNAISSWKRLVLPENIIVVAADEYSCDFIREELGVRCMLDTDCIHPNYRRTVMSCVWGKVHAAADTEMLTFVNSDIILMDDFADTILYLKTQLNNFVMVGQRVDVEINDIIDFTVQKEVSQLKTHADMEGDYHGEWGLDYFVHTKTHFREIIDFPPFLVGVYRWDNWLLSEFIVHEDVDVVDATDWALAIHQDDKNRGGHPERPGAEYNDALTKRISAHQYKLGNIHCTDYILMDECTKYSPTTCLEKNMDRDEHLVTFFRKMSDDLNLAILTVNYGYIELGLNWVCWAERVGFTNYILLAEDEESYEAFTRRGVDVVIADDAPKRKEAYDYGTPEFQETMMYRTNFFMKVLSHGINFMTIDIDTVIFDDPFKYVNSTADIQGQQHKNVKMSGGLIYVRATEAGVNFWRTIIRCQERNMEFIANNAVGTYEPSKYTEQYCINQNAANWAKKKMIKKHLLLNNRFGDGKSFFESQISQKEGIWPVVVHNNWIKGYDKKLQRFKDWNLWSIDDNDQCIQEELSQPEITTDVSYKIRVLTFNRPESLMRLLKSLKMARYGYTNVDLVISIDFPEGGAADEDVEARWKIIDLTKNFEWPYGNYEVEIRYEHYGLVGQWINGWSPENDNEVIIVFEDDIEVSRIWFDWTQRAVEAYYANWENYDPRLYGISLQSQYTILGESIEYSYGQRTPASILEDSDHLYKFQQVGTWGTVLFAPQWREFVAWYKSRPEGFKPCVPNLISNSWWEANADSVWSQWIVRFAFEKGYYMLYTNFAGNEALTTNWREKGPHFDGISNKTNELIKNLTPSEQEFPPLATIPLYDFSFNRITSNPEILHYRQNMFPSLNEDSNVTSQVDNCWTLQSFQQQIKSKTAKKSVKKN